MTVARVVFSGKDAAGPEILGQNALNSHLREQENYGSDQVGIWDQRPLDTSNQLEHRNCSNR